MHQTVAARNITTSSSSLKEELLNLKRAAIKRNATLHRLHGHWPTGRKRTKKRKSGIARQRLRETYTKEKDESIVQLSAGGVTGDDQIVFPRPGPNIREAGPMLALRPYTVPW
jgi:hypothetical protein